MTKIAVMIGQLGLGGSERQLYSFLELCDRDRWDPTVYVSGTLGPWKDPIRELGISVVLVQGNPVMKMWRFRHSCRINRIRRFFSWSDYTNGYGLALLGLDIYCIGSFRYIYPLESSGRSGLLRSWMNVASTSTMVCNSQETAAAVRRRVGNRKRVVYIPNGVEQIQNVDVWRKTWRKHLEVSEAEVLILGVGRVEAQKNFARFVEAVMIVNKKKPVRAVVAGGDEGCLDNLKQQVAESGLDPDVLRFIGPVPDARELACAADIFVLSSDYEGMPNVVLEAMVVGVPCVCTNVNGVNSLIENGVNGFITEHRADALADRILQLVRDAGFRRGMGARAAESVKGRFDPPSISARLWQLCE